MDNFFLWITTASWGLRPRRLARSARPGRFASSHPAAPNRNAPMAHKPARCQAARQTAAPFNLYPNHLSALKRLIALQREHAARAGTKGRGLYSRKGSLQRLGSPPDTRSRDRRRIGQGKEIRPLRPFPGAHRLSSAGIFLFCISDDRAAAVWRCEWRLGLIPFDPRELLCGPGGSNRLRGGVRRVLFVNIKS